MNSMTDLYRKRRAASPSTCAPADVICTTCGMLECLCRPRFFPGMVLTADDLNRLDFYIRGKHRLHNRQLHGWGVVNGLEVTCGPCGDGVVVGCGYALSPCGDDIVVCDSVSVDVCALINHCRAQENPDRCAAPKYQGAGCDEGEEQWVLAIRYDESPQRGVMPLQSASASTSCGCGGGKSKQAGGCGCSSGGGGKSCGCGSGACGCSSKGGGTKPRAAPVQCEPTVVCEGYRFEVYRLPEKAKDPIGYDDDDKSIIDANDSDLTRRFMCCAKPLISSISKAPSTLPAEDPAGWRLWALRFRDFLARHLASKPGYNCELQARLQLIAIPAQQDGQDPALQQALELLFAVWLDALLACFCSALLPPCPPATTDQRVPLAVLHVSRKPCRVLSICNWTTERKFATTFPSLQYWLSVLPFGRVLRTALESICCFDVSTLFGDHDGEINPAPGQPPPPPPVAVPVAPAPAPAVEPAAAAGEPAFSHSPPKSNVEWEIKSSSDAMSRATMRLNPDVSGRFDGIAEMMMGAFARGSEPLDAAAFVSSFLMPRLAGGALSSTERANVPQFLLMNQIARPIAVAAAEPFAPLLRAFGLGAGKKAEVKTGKREAASDDVAQLRAELAEMKSAMREQASQIDALRQRVKPAGGRKS